MVKALPPRGASQTLSRAPNVRDSQLPTLDSRLLTHDLRLWTYLIPNPESLIPGRGYCPCDEGGTMPFTRK